MPINKSIEAAALKIQVRFMCSFCFCLLSVLFLSCFCLLSVFCLSFVCLVSVLFLSSVSFNRRNVQNMPPLIMQRAEDAPFFPWI